MFFPYLEHVSGSYVLPSSAFLILHLVKYLCVGWLLLLWFPVGLWYLKLVLSCVIVVYILVFCEFSMLSALKIVSYFVFVQVISCFVFYVCIFVNFSKCSLWCLCVVYVLLVLHWLCPGIHVPVSYTHLDVYKRQVPQCDHVVGKIQSHCALDKFVCKMVCPVFLLTYLLVRHPVVNTWHSHNN